MEVSQGVFFFLFFLFLPPLSQQTCSHYVPSWERNQLVKKKSSDFWKFFIYEESHQEQAVINTHNWNKLQLTAEECLPAADRRKLLTAFSHSMKKRERRREKGTLPSPCRHMATVCACTFRARVQPVQCTSLCMNLHVQTCHMCRCKPSLACICKDCTCVPVGSLMSGFLPCWTRCVPTCRVTVMSG